MSGGLREKNGIVKNFNSAVNGTAQGYEFARNHVPLSVYIFLMKALRFGNGLLKPIY